MPMLYVIFRKMRERAKQRFGDSGETPHPPANAAATGADSVPHA
jgi:hypothetical protein